MEKTISKTKSMVFAALFAALACVFTFPHRGPAVIFIREMLLSFYPVSFSALFTVVWPQDLAPRWLTF